MGDGLSGHELLQNAWLKVKGHTSKRGTGPASRDNPAIALKDDQHKRVDKAQSELGLHDAAELDKLEAEDVIELNYDILYEDGIPVEQLDSLLEQSLDHAENLP